MKFFKTTLLAGVLSINMAAPVFANQAPITEQIQPFTAADTQSLFEQDAKPMQLAALSQTEMKETEGAWVQFGIGGALGGAGYAWGVYQGNYAWNTRNFIGNVGTGALIGGTFGAAGAIASGGARFIPSLTNAGANIWRFNSATANWGVNHVWRR
jgi:hypothetical protein